ncbi:Retrovirus-related Pol polyprotein from transposon 412 [Exaiptasia diaphana]|nr:Retrovirus-related Pol polyprotein from transposon 412 [Exaiptasia diaphana]
MTVMGESVKRLSDGTKNAEPAAKKARYSPEPGGSGDIINELLTDGQNTEDQEAGNLDEDNLLDEILQSLNESEHTGEAVCEKLAKVANTSWLHKLSDRQLKENISKYHRASNCNKVVVPKVNDEIWGKLSRSARGKDVKYQHLQTNVTKVRHIAVKLTESVLALRKKAEPSLGKELNDFALLGHCSFEISQLRRKDINPNLPAELLFGDELQTQITHIRAANKIGNTASSSSSNQRRTYRPYDSEGRNFFNRATPVHQFSRGSKRKYMNNNYHRTKSAENQNKKFNAENFQAGQPPRFMSRWRDLTSDPEILETVAGQHIEFTRNPIQVNPPFQPKWSQEESYIIDSEINKLLSKCVIEQCEHQYGEFISTIFLRPKMDGTKRMILNLKSLNQYVVYHHFKMDKIWTVVDMMKPNCYMASIDLKDAYHSISIAEQYQKYLKFKWRGNLYKFTCFPNGLALCPRKFTKLLKPVYSTLRQMGHLSVSYIDDSYLQAGSYGVCVSNIIDTVTLLNDLGFVIHPEKSILIPTQMLVFLGFLLDSTCMHISLTSDKALKVKLACHDLLNAGQPSIRQVAKFLGLLTSSFPGVMYGPLYRYIELDKIQVLRHNKGNFYGSMSLSLYAKKDIEWWIQSVETAYNIIHHGVPQLTMTTDASKKGSGAC